MRFKKIISVLTLAIFISTNIAYAAPDSRSVFKNKKVDHKKISSEQAEVMDKKKAVLRGETVDREKEASQKKEAQRILSSHLSDLSQVHIPQEIGRVVEVYEAPGSELHAKGENRLIVHIQDLHTNPEGEFNLAKILEILLKDYNLGLVCSEGADGVVDTSSVSNFPDPAVREKVANLFVNSGELTGEEYLSITKYPDMPIWGIENKDIYFKNIEEFNRIMKFNPDSQVFISQAKKSLDELKPKIYSKEILSIDQKETDYANQNTETTDYLKYLSSYIQKLNIPTADYKNVALLNETIIQESKIDQQKIMQESQNLLINLQAVIADNSNRADMDTLMVKASLFKDQKISPFSFYSYLKDLANKHLKDQISKYSNLTDFVDYLTKVNSLDSTKLFVEMEDLTYDIKQRLARNEEERNLTQSIRNIKFLEGFFNLKISNEELDYYLQNKDSHKVSFFEAFLKPAINKYNLASYIDFNPDLIDAHLQEIEDFYKTVKQRDLAMFNNTVSEVEKRNVKVVAFISGGFHTKGVTRLLKDRGYSYIVISPYSKTDIDEENYHFLLSGKRKPIEDLIKQLDVPQVASNSSSQKLRVPLVFDKESSAGKRVEGVLASSGRESASNTGADLGAIKQIINGNEFLRANTPSDLLRSIEADNDKQRLALNGLGMLVSHYNWVTADYLNRPEVTAEEKTAVIKELQNDIYKPMIGCLRTISRRLENGNLIPNAVRLKLSDKDQTVPEVRISRRLKVSLLPMKGDPWQLGHIWSILRVLADGSDKVVIMLDNSDPERKPQLTALPIREADSQWLFNAFSPFVVYTRFQRDRAPLLASDGETILPTLIHENRTIIDLIDWQYIAGYDHFKWVTSNSTGLLLDTPHKLFFDMIRFLGAGFSVHISARFNKREADSKDSAKDVKDRIKTIETLTQVSIINFYSDLAVSLAREKMPDAEHAINEWRQEMQLEIMATLNDSQKRNFEQWNLQGKDALNEQGTDNPSVRIWLQRFKSATAWAKDDTFSALRKMLAARDTTGLINALRSYAYNARMSFEVIEQPMDTSSTDVRNHGKLHTVPLPIARSIIGLQRYSAFTDTKVWQKDKDIAAEVIAFLIDSGLVKIEHGKVVKRSLVKHLGPNLTSAINIDILTKRLNERLAKGDKRSIVFNDGGIESVAIVLNNAHANALHAIDSYLVGFLLRDDMRRILFTRGHMTENNAIEFINNIRDSLIGKKTAEIVAQSRQMQLAEEIDENALASNKGVVAGRVDLKKGSADSNWWEQAMMEDLAKNPTPWGDDAIVPVEKDKGILKVTLTAEMFENWSLEKPAGRDLDTSTNKYDEIGPLAIAGIRHVMNIANVHDTRQVKNSVERLLTTVALGLMIKMKYNKGAGFPYLVNYGHEVRYHSQEFQDITTRALAAMGFVCNVAPGSVPVAIWDTSTMGKMFDMPLSFCGTSSHSPSSVDGLKIMDYEGSQFLISDIQALIAIKQAIVQHIKEKGSFTFTIAAESDPRVTDQLYKSTRNGMAVYREYQERTAADELILGLIKTLDPSKIHIDCMHGSGYRTLKAFFKEMGLEDITDKIDWMHTEERPDFGNIGKVKEDPRTGKEKLFDLGADGTQMMERVMPDGTIVKYFPVLCTADYPEKLANMPIGDIILPTDMDNDRLFYIQIMPNDEATKKLLDETGVVYNVVNAEKIAAIHIPNKSFHLLQDMNLERIVSLMKQGKMSKDRAIVILKTLASTPAVDQWAEKKARELEKEGIKIRVINTAVGFAKLANVMYRAEGVMRRHPGEDVIISDAAGKDINIGTDPLILAAWEESGGIIVGTTKRITDLLGNPFLAMREKSATESIFLSLALISKLQKEKGTVDFAAYLKEIYIDAGVTTPIDLRYDNALYVPAATRESALEEIAGNERKNRIFGAYLAIVIAKMRSQLSVEEAKKILKDMFDQEYDERKAQGQLSPVLIERFSRVNFDLLKDIWFTGDGVMFVFEDKGKQWFVLFRPSGTEPKLKSYGFGEDVTRLAIDAWSFGFNENISGKLPESFTSKAALMDLWGSDGIKAVDKGRRMQQAWEDYGLVIDPMELKIKELEQLETRRLVREFNPPDNHLELVNQWLKEHGLPVMDIDFSKPQAMPQEAIAGLLEAVPAEVYDQLGSSKEDVLRRENITTRTQASVPTDGDAGRGSVWGALNTFARLGIKAGDKITVLGIQPERRKEEGEVWSESSVRREFTDAENLGIIKRTGAKDERGREIFEVLVSFANDQLEALPADVKMMLDRGRIKEEEIAGIVQAINDVMGKNEKRGEEQLRPILAKLKSDKAVMQLDGGVYGESFEGVRALNPKWAEVGFEKAANRFGWTLENLKWISRNPDKIQQVLDDAKEIRTKYRYVIFCGMGGSGLSVQTVKTTFGEPENLTIYSLRTTDPAVIKDILDNITKKEGSLEAALSYTLVIPVSKSGKTEETVSHKKYFESLFSKLQIDIKDHMWVVTDKGSPMDTGVYTQREIQLNGKGDIGGRFTAPTTNIFLLPLALVAPEKVNAILEKARAMNEIENIDNDTFIRLGAYLYYMAAEAGKDKVTFMVPEELQDLPMWSEQLVEESLGKDGKGVTVFYGEDISEASLRDVEKNDRVFLRINIGGKKTGDELWKRLEKNGYPVFEINADDIDSIGGIMLGLQRAVATVGYLWDICFVDQPAVEGYKNATREVMSKLQPGERVGVPHDWKSVSFGKLKLYYDRLIQVGAITEKELETEVQRLDAAMDDAAAVYAAIINILKAKPGFEAKELTSYGRMTEGMRDILQRARTSIFTYGLKMPSKFGEGPDKNHSYHQNIEGGKDMWLSTYFMPLQIEQPEALLYDDNLIRAQTIGTVNSIANGGRKVILITFDSTTKDAEGDAKLFFEKVSSYLNTAPKSRSLGAAATRFSSGTTDALIMANRLRDTADALMLSAKKETMPAHQRFNLLKEAAKHYEEVLVLLRNIHSIPNNFDNTVEAGKKAAENELERLFSRKQQVGSEEKIVVRSARKAMENKDAFVEWLAGQEADVAVVVIAETIDEYKKVEEFKDIAHLKIRYREDADKGKLKEALGLEDYQLLLLNDSQSVALFGFLDDSQSKDGVRLNLINDIINSNIAREVSSGV